MSENENKSYRMLQKRDTDENWENSTFTPKAGEIVIFKENADKNTPQRIRIGNDETPAKDLKNIVGEVYVQAQRPECAGEGAVWITPDEGLESGEKIIEQIEITENEDGSVKMENFFIGGGSEIIVLAAGNKPDGVTYNDLEIPIRWR